MLPMFVVYFGLSLCQATERVDSQCVTLALMIPHVRKAALVHAVYGPFIYIARSQEFRSALNKIKLPFSSAQSLNRFMWVLSTSKSTLIKVNIELAFFDADFVCNWPSFSHLWRYEQSLLALFFIQILLCTLLTVQISYSLQCSIRWWQYNHWRIFSSINEAKNWLRLNSNRIRMCIKSVEIARMNQKVVAINTKLLNIPS